MKPHWYMVMEKYEMGGKMLLCCLGKVLPPLQKNFVLLKIVHLLAKHLHFHAKVKHFWETFYMVLYFLYGVIYI